MKNLILPILKLDYCILIIEITSEERYSKTPMDQLWKIYNKIALGERK